MSYQGRLRVIEPAPKRPPVPSMDERAAFFRRAKTTVAEQVGDGRPPLAVRIACDATLAFLRVLWWVGKKLNGRAS